MTEPYDYYGEALKAAVEGMFPEPELVAALQAEIAESLEDYIKEKPVYDGRALSGIQAIVGRAWDKFVRKLDGGCG